MAIKSKQSKERQLASRALNEGTTNLKEQEWWNNEDFNTRTKAW